MQTLQNDWTLVSSAGSELEEFLLSPQIFWPIHEGGRQTLPGDMSRLSVGNLLLSLARLNAAQPFVSQIPDSSIVFDQIQNMRQRWLSNWRKKAQQEIPIRLNRWQAYVSELASSPSSLRGDYPYNIRYRVILQLLFQEVPDQDIRVLINSDQRLRGISQPAGFIWDAAIQPGFSKETYWYLYRQP